VNQGKSGRGGEFYFADGARERYLMHLGKCVAGGSKKAWRVARDPQEIEKMSLTLLETMLKGPGRSPMTRTVGDGSGKGTPQNKEVNTHTYRLSNLFPPAGIRRGKGVLHCGKEWQGAHELGAETPKPYVAEFW